MRRLNQLMILACCLINFACTKNSSNTGTNSAQDEKVIKIGQYGSMTGGEATFGQSTDKGIRLAIDAKNAAGGIKGQQIELLTEDNQGLSRFRVYERFALREKDPTGRVALLFQFEVEPER